MRGPAGDEWSDTMNFSNPSLIETMRVDADGGMPLLDRHMARLLDSCRTLGYPCPEDEDAIRHEVLVAARTISAPGAHRLRLLLHATGERTIESSPLPPLVDMPGVVTCDTRLASTEMLLRHKTTFRPWYDPIGQWLTSHSDIFDALFVNERGELCEGSRSNVYARSRNKWFTPPISSGCLPGVQRAALLDQGLAEERLMDLDALRCADEIRLSNALRGWITVMLR
jgi:4-amino-4-deoxychorismate lyase